MNLEDLLDEEGLQQDEWSLSRPRFGKEGQLEVVGWSGRCARNKFYILKCTKCSQDRELFGEGFFTSPKGNLVKRQIPCGCSRTKWSREQYVVLCTREAKELGYTFLGFGAVWEGKKTKIEMLCEKHGGWGSGIIDSLINAGRGCPWCGVDSTTKAAMKPDAYMIATFFASGAFHQDTKFCRSSRLDYRGHKCYWYMSCPECGQQGEASSDNLQSGKRPCACPKHRQQEGYINWIVENSQAIALKLGVANNSNRRVAEQNSKSVYDVLNHSIYTFPDKPSCLAAEQECKQTLKCGILTKEEFPDGWTETTDVLNLGRIKQIYLKHGGVLT